MSWRRLNKASARQQDAGQEKASRLEISSKRKEGYIRKQDRKYEKDIPEQDIFLERLSVHISRTESLLVNSVVMLVILPVITVVIIGIADLPVHLIQHQSDHIRS